jgi:membrane associated rhomboid family serine protease
MTSDTSHFAPTGHSSTRNSSEASTRSPFDELKAKLRELLATLIERAFGVAMEKVEQLAKAFEDIAAHGGITFNALLGGARASLAGRSPVWGAIVAAVSSLSPGARAALIIALVLALILLPITVVLLLLALLVLAVVAVAKASSTAS